MNNALASQPTLSRFYNWMDDKTLEQFKAFNRNYQGHGYLPLLCYVGLTGIFRKQNFGLEAHTAAMALRSL